MNNKVLAMFKMLFEMKYIYIKALQEGLQHDILATGLRTNMNNIKRIVIF